MKSYLITDLFFYGSNPKIFSKKLLDILELKTSNVICISDKQTKNHGEMALDIKKSKNLGLHVEKLGAYVL